MSYLLMVSHGTGRRYVWGKEIESVITATELASKQAKYLNENKGKGPPKVIVTVLRKVGEYGDETR